MTVLTIHDLWNGKQVDFPDNVLPFHPTLVAKEQKPEEPEQHTELSGLIESIRELTERVAWLERERAEAMLCANQIADQRDGLVVAVQNLESTIHQSHEQMQWLEATIEGMADAVSTVAASPMAALVRRRLMSAIAI